PHVPLQRSPRIERLGFRLAYELQVMACFFSSNLQQNFSQACEQRVQLASSTPLARALTTLSAQLQNGVVRVPAALKKPQRPVIGRPRARALLALGPARRLGSA
ncbi:MAG TPA: hypothetical protein VJV79_01415, partial [Polyangiaceae bacterium]|nr:hypothetical protein [Polyangiaceae bacterium]